MVGWGWPTGGGGEFKVPYRGFLSGLVASRLGYQPTPPKSYRIFQKSISKNGRSKIFRHQKNSTTKFSTTEDIESMPHMPEDQSNLSIGQLFSECIQSWLSYRLMMRQSR